MTCTIESKTRVKTKIVATVGPASESVDRLADMVRAGVDVFRINMAHGQPKWRETVLDRIRHVSTSIGQPIAILADLGGPKIRLGPIPGGSVHCEVGQLFRFVNDRAASGAANVLTSTYDSLVKELQVGNLLLLADGTVTMRVDERGSDSVVCSIVQPGEIRSGCGINLPGVELAVAALTDKDFGDVCWGALHGVDFFGLSFVRRASDVRQLRDELNRLGCKAQIVAKIEKPQAVAALDEIICDADAVMVARGDLGVEIDVARIAAVQKHIIRRCNEARKPVITATQMLESMRSNRLPTRAEATDVANAVLDGSDALMLSAETAVGQFPVEAVAMMSRIAYEAEQMLEPRFGRSTGSAGCCDGASIIESLVEATSRLADQVGAKLVVVATSSGNTALVLSKQRSHTPILGISDNDATLRRICLYWGVTPFRAEHFSDYGTLLNHVTHWAKDMKLLAPGDRVALIASTHWTATGHNMIVIHEVN